MSFWNGQIAVFLLFISWNTDLRFANQSIMNDVNANSVRLGKKQLANRLLNFYHELYFTKIVSCIKWTDILQNETLHCHSLNHMYFIEIRPFDIQYLILRKKSTKICMFILLNMYNITWLWDEIHVNLFTSTAFAW